MPKLLVISGPSGVGKCLGRGTPVMLHTGEIRPVENILAGDRLMGPDGRQRTVLSISSGHGPLYKISPIKGEPWVCNENHVLSLRNCTTHAVRDVSLVDYLHNRSKWFRATHKLFTTGVRSFGGRVRRCPVDPYFLGLWFGDGTKEVKLIHGQPGLASVSISKPDLEIKQECEKQAGVWGLTVNTYGGYTYHLSAGKGQKNPLLEAFRELLGPDLLVPSCILWGERQTRLEFLAGFLDADGELQHNCFTITQKRKTWADALWWLARSLGLCSTRTTRQAKCQTGTGGTYYVVHISGDISQIPVRLKKRKPLPRKQVKEATHTGFSVEPIGEGDYYGFELDGDHRFLLGDFTVTHNSSVARELVSTGKFSQFRTSTSRPRRNGESPEAYHFMGLGDFVQAVYDGYMLEWAEVHGNLYGILATELEIACRTGSKTPILIADVNGHAALRQKIEDEEYAEGTGNGLEWLSMRSVFLVPPEPQMENLRRWLTMRGEPEESIAVRLASAEREMRRAHEYDLIHECRDIRTTAERIYQWWEKCE